MFISNFKQIEETVNKTHLMNIVNKVVYVNK